VSYEWDIERYIAAQDRRRSASITLLLLPLIFYFLMF